ncbi:uncharacterized protein LOC129371361 [Poeciliopsis prolifica]|uniref:uncharacterized protein LOC129371361 n=1 Tax=Poeciliopsis prolifica TaxID=188132 RepID=UPI002413A4D8|nr:uncharacterized protein LOC129371361 [Poeciliopsis prolifica]
MSHECGRSSSEKNYLYNNQSKATDKKCCATALTGDSKYSNHERDKRHKTKRLRTRKERCQMRADRRDTSKHKSHHHHCFSQSKKKNPFYSNNHHSCHSATRKNTQILSTVSQEPSIITESRLLGHHGLFNHEVKSINIERVLSEQSKLEQSEEKTNDNNNTPYLSSTPHNPIVLSSYGLLGADTDVPDKKKAKTGSKTNDDSQDIEMTNLQFSNPGADITSSQRLHQQLPSSCESLKSTNQSKSRFKTTKTKHTESCMSGMDKALHPKPLDTKDKIKTVNKTINEDQDSSSQTDYLVSSPLHVTSVSADNFDQQNLHQDPNNVWKTTHEVAELLSEWLHLPVPNRRNLSSKTREVLLKTLQERHGPHLQANLQEMQRSLRFHKDPSQVSNEQEQMIRDDMLFPTDASVKTTGSEHLCWTSSPQTCNTLQQITEEFANPVDTFVKPLDETFKPGSFPFLQMDFEPSGTSLTMVILDGVFNQSSYDYDNDYEIKDEDEDVDVHKAVWIPILFSILVIVGLLGNGLLLAVLAQKRRPWRISDSFILQLGVVDILLLLTLPVHAAQATQSCGWCSQIVLMVCGAFFKINLYVGGFLLVCICLDLYFSSTHTGWYRNHRTSLVILGCLLVWLISISLSVLDGIFLVNTESLPGKALSAHPHLKTKVDWQLISRVLHLGVGFWIPALIQIVFCSHIMIQCKSNRQIKIRSVLLILSLVGASLLCWIPYNITLIIDTICYTKTFLTSVFVDPINSLKAAVKATSAVSCISACVRPPLYFLFCGNFRKPVFSILTCAKVDCKSSLWELGVEAPHDQCHSEEEMKQMTKKTGNDRQKYAGVTQTSPEGRPAQKGEVLKP